MSETEAPQDVLPVLVVGAGPVGLTAALALRSHGLPVVLLEAEPEDRVRPGSRALFVHRESLQLLGRISPGLDRTLVDHGVVWPTRRTVYRGREVFARTYPPRTPSADFVPPFTSLRQVETERHLLAACRRAGVSFRWGTPVRGVRAFEDAVEVDTGRGPLRARYVIGADGARSSVRRSQEITMEGDRSEAFHVVVDIQEDADDPMPLERVFTYEHPGLGGRSVMRVPFAGGFQLDVQCKDDDTPEEWADEAAVRRWVPRVVPAKYAERVLWVSRYHFLHLVADRFADAHRRVLLVGEASHLFPPFGARGMNSGIADSVAAADSVAEALDAPGRRLRAVDEFALLRREAALFNSDAARTALDHLRPKRRLTRLKQAAGAALAPVLPSCGEWLERAPYGPRNGARTNPRGRY
ncbi:MULTISPECIES: FAD-dependent monooxygenase [unclassified Streptomyces]|uniref:FAD-dependent monooxygenase n=1 Tax=unclassified Streptomyces TaxID=2593676 RepID=UPI0022B713BD|nr:MULTISPECIES: FAD-dependent monooxygenase [unclassified Streptomyces]MCZ7416807.1 FAD-dependent monooxygenase [Streptomyces sp. WMMC897]MCZ7433383.1 FAD-dependent monooxygenase [Streptomyces sp. WMMC1477]